MMLNRIMSFALPLAGALLCAVPVVSTAETTKFGLSDVASQAHFFDATMTEELFRKMATRDPAAAVKGFFSREASEKWRQDTQYLTGEQLKDFFFGAINLRGPFDGKCSLAGLYNPWSDALLLTESVAEKAGSGDVIRKVVDFRLLDGAVFRGETAPGEMSGPGDYPLGELMTVVAARRYAATEKQFLRLYPQHEIPLLQDHAEADTELNRVRLAARSAARLQMALNLIRNKPVYAEAYNWTRAFPRILSKELDLCFDTPGSAPMTKSFARMPRVFRRYFLPYAYLTSPTSPNGRSLLFVNAKYPSLCVEMHLGYGFGKNIFFWFDFAHADTLTQMAPAKPAAGKAVTK